MGKHTPGEWKACHSGTCECGKVWGPDGNVVVAIAMGAAYHATTDAWPNAETQQANALLIAASPDLLEVAEAIPAALTEMQDIMRRHGFKIDNLEDPMQKLAFTLYTALCELDNKAQPAIAKARGGNSESQERTD